MLNTLNILHTDIDGDVINAAYITLTFALLCLTLIDLQ